MGRYLIVNADDFGLTPGVSDGILRAHREGILTSTTFMVNFPWAGEMAGLLREAPDLGVGIHLNLTTGAPVLPPERVPSLVTRAGAFVRSVWRALARIQPEEARAEWMAQVEKGVKLLGRTPTHLDTHRFLQAYPPLCEAMLEVARQFGIKAVRILYPEFVPRGEFRRWSPAGFIVDRSLRRSAMLTRESGLSHPDQTLAGDFDLTGLLERLDRVEEGVNELISHPGQADDQLAALTSLREQREVELAALTAPEARQRIEARSIQLIHFGHFG
ncbi:MAG: carbohydrate deacetylase [Bacillota bacterium]